MSDCLQPNDFERLRKGFLDESERQRVETHLGGCSACQAAYDEYLDDQVFLADAVPRLKPRPSDGETEALRQAERPPASERLPRIEGYRIIRWIGAGGMAVVYEAVQNKLNRRVALKLLPAIAGAAQPRMIERFRREATAAAQLHHTHIIPIYDFGESRDGCYYAMELIQGQTLRTLIKRLAAMDAPDLSAADLAALVQATQSASDASAPSDPASDSGSSSSGGASTSGRGRLYYRQAAQWMADVADALHYAHNCGIIHRDIKPANLILSTDGRIMVADFGLAKTAGEESVTVSGSLIGTYRYMSPEQVGAKRVRVDARTDVYSLGATLYEMLALRPVFEAGDREELLGQILFDEPIPPRRVVPSIPVELQTICLKAVEKSPQARYATARDLADDLRRFTSDLPIVARPIGPVGRTVKFVRRHKAAAITTACILALASAVALFAFKARGAQRERIAALIREGTAESDRGNWNASERAFRNVLNLDPSNLGAIFSLARMKKDHYYQTGDEKLMDEADALLARGCELAPDNLRFLDVRGVFLKIRGRHDEAAAAHQAVVQMDPSYYSAWANLGTVRALQCRLPEAEDHLQRSVKLAEEQRAEAYRPRRNLGAVQLQLQKPEAAETLRIALDHAKVDVATLLLLAKLHLVLESHVDPKKALGYAMTAQTHAGESRSGLGPRLAKRMLAWAHVGCEHWADADEAAKSALDLGDASPYPHLIRAIARARTGDPAGAKSHLLSAESAWPDALNQAGFVPVPDQDKSVLWFDSADELHDLRAEAERLLP